ncbi:MAG: glycosyltransferase family 39 protein [Victivallaceae bacterium]|nr:glycosyltransferase family 39 protein [Victivallaceae bacterium]
MQQDTTLTISPRRGFWLLLLFAAVTFFALTGVRELRSGDETRVAGISAEMQVYDDLLVPRLNGKPFLEYPPLHYWCTTLAFDVLGRTDAAAKVPAAAAAAASALVVFFFALKLGYPVWAALLSGVMLATSAQFFDNGRKAMVDIGLAFFILLSVYAIYAMCRSGSTRKKAAWCGVAAAALCGGVLTKGMLGLLMPGMIGGGWLLLDDLRKKHISYGNWLWLAAAGVIGTAGASIWYIELYRSAGYEMFHTAFFVNNLGRFTGSQGDHTEAWYYYFIKLPSLFWPWLPLLPFAIWHEIKVWHRTGEPGRAIALVFLLLPFTVLCIASSKRIVYLEMLYAPSAMLCGRLLYELPPKASRWLDTLAARLPKSLRRLETGALVKVAVAVALVMAMIDAGRGLVQNRSESLRTMFEDCAILEQAGKTIVLCDAPERTRGAAVFYLGHRVKEQLSPLPPQGDDEYRIFRNKKLHDHEYADYHHLIAPGTTLK